MGYKVYSDSYLMSLTKAQIIELLRVAEHNFFATEEALNNSAKAGMEIAEKYDKAKRLLKAAMGDMEILYETGKDEGCVGIKFKWRYADEALELIGDKLE